MGFWASGDESSASDWKPPPGYGKPSGPGAEESKAFADSGGYAKMPASVMASRDNSKAVGSFYDDRDSSAFKSRMYADLSALGSRAAPQAGKTSLGAGARTSAATVGPMSMYGGAKANFGNSNAVAAQQAALIARMSGIADGSISGPGVDQLKANLGATVAAQTSAAGSGAARFGGGAALRGLAGSKAAASQQTAATGAIVGAQEQQAAQSMLSGLASSARGSAYDQAAGQAAFDQQASMFNAGASNSAALAGAGFRQQAGMFNATAGQKQYEMDQQVAMSNMEASLRAQGLDDAAISARLGFLQAQMNRDKQDKMAFWDYAAGTHKFDASMQFQQDTMNAQAGASRWAAGGGAVGSMAGAWGSGSGSGGSGGGWSGDMSGASKSADGYSYGDAETAGKLGGG